MSHQVERMRSQFRSRIQKKQLPDQSTWCKKTSWNKVKKTPIWEKEVPMFFMVEIFLSQDQVSLHLKASLVSPTNWMWLSNLIHWNYLRIQHFWSFQLQLNRITFSQAAPPIYLNPDVDRQLFFCCLFPYQSSSFLLSTWTSLLPCTHPAFSRSGLATAFSV